MRGSWEFSNSKVVQRFLKPTAIDYACCELKNRPALLLVVAGPCDVVIITLAFSPANTGKATPFRVSCWGRIPTWGRMNPWRASIVGYSATETIADVF